MSLEPYYQNDLVTLYKGDCLEVMDDLILQEIKVDAIITDLPYGTSRAKSFRDVVIPFDELWVRFKQLRKPYIAIVLFGKEPFSSMLRFSNLEEFKYDWIWKKDTKSNFPQAPYQPLNNLEIISIFSDGYARYGDKKMRYNPQMVKSDGYKLPKDSKTTSIFADNHKNGVYKHKVRDTSLRYPYNILEFNTDKIHCHQTQKPIALMEYLIKTYTDKGDLVLDATAGSGTTGVACMNTNRKCVLIEKEEKYCEITKQRLEEASRQEKLFTK